MSIRFDEQPGLALKAKRPSKLEPWEVWAHEEARWVDLKGAHETVVERYLMPTTNPHGRDAAAYLEEILPGCDGYHVLVVYRHPLVDDELDHDRVSLGLARSRAPFSQGSRNSPPNWSYRKSRWDRLGADDDPV